MLKLPSIWLSLSCVLQEACVSIVAWGRHHCNVLYYRYVLRIKLIYYEMSNEEEAVSCCINQDSSPVVLNLRAGSYEWKKQLQCYTTQWWSSLTKWIKTSLAPFATFMQLYSWLLDIWHVSILNYRYTQFLGATCIYSEFRKKFLYIPVINTMYNIILKLFISAVIIKQFSLCFILKVMEVMCWTCA